MTRTALLTNSCLAAFIMMTATPVFAQDDSKYGDTPEQQAACKENLSLYETYYKQKNYDDAYPFWKNACEVCPPKVSQNMYIKGVNLLKRQMKAAIKEKNNERAIALRDSVFLFYDLRIEHFPNTSKKPNNGCEVLARKAMDWTSLNKRAAAEARPMFEEAILCLEDKADAAVLNGYYALLVDALNGADDVETKETAIGDLLNEYLRLSDFIELGRQREVAAADSAAADKYVTTQKNLDEIFVQVANCEDMVPVLTKKIEAAPEDIDIKKKTLRLLNEKGCTDNDIFLPVAEAVYAVEKNADAAYSIGIQLSKKGDYGAALPYFEESVELCEDCPKLSRNLMKAGQVAKNAGQVSKCLRYARRAAKADPGNGEPYLLIGDAIASMVGSCSDSPLQGREVYWLATDYYQRAKSVDANVASKANTKISQVKKSYPTIDDLFTYGINEGKEITVKCLGETTKARKP
jgi:tetratricopeptide (TPR) repeat protein